MGLISSIKNIFHKNSTQIPLSDSELLNWLGIDASNVEAINEATYYTCVKMISETLGKLPLHYYQHTAQGRVKADPTDATLLLTTRPNQYMTPTTLWTTTEMLRQHYGNAFVLIHSRLDMTSRYKGVLKYLGLYIMHPKDVTIWIDNAGIFGKDNAITYEWRDPISHKSYVFGSDDVMHFRTWYSTDGITGKPVREILKDTISTAGQSQKVLSNLYQNGMTASMVMQYTSDLDDERVKMLQKKFADKLTGAQAAGKVIPIPIGLQLTPLNTKLTDNQFYELKKYNATQIASAFGVPTSFLGENSTYNGSEQQHLSFLVDTMSPILKQYEEEINAKLLTPEQQKNGYYYKFNERAILRTDMKTQMDTLTSAVNNGIYTPNEARSYLDLPDDPDGDFLMANGNYIKLSQVGTQYGNGGTDNENN